MVHIIPIHILERFFSTGGGGGGGDRLAINYNWFYKQAAPAVWALILLDLSHSLIHCQIFLNLWSPNNNNKQATIKSHQSLQVVACCCTSVLSSLHVFQDVNNTMWVCAYCKAFIRDNTMLQVVTEKYHCHCLRCHACNKCLERERKCYSRLGNIYCTTHYFRYAFILFLSPYAAWWISTVGD